MSNNIINPFTNTTNPFKTLQSGNKTLLTKYLATKDMAQYEKLQYQKTDAEIKITSYGTLVNNLSIMNEAITKMQKSISGIKTFQSSDLSYLSATVSSYASSGNYNVQIGRLAQKQVLSTAIFSSPNDSVADLSTYNSQNLKIQVGSNEAKTITINSANNTLTGIKNAINDANAGVTAEISKFDITDSNNKIVFKIGDNNYTATIENGNYTGDQLAYKVKMAFINAFNKGGDKFDVQYDDDVNRFTISNKSGSTMQILWDDPSTTASSILGYNSNTVTINNNDELTSDNEAQISGYRLVLTSSNTGANNKITIEADIDGNGIFGEASAGELDNLGIGRLVFNATYDSNNNITGGVTNMTQTQKAQDALLKVNNIEYVRNTNNISDLILGVTLNLLKSDENYSTSPKTFRLSIYPMGLEANLKAFVSSFNITADVIEKQKGTPKEPGVLADDAFMNNFDSDLRNFFLTNGSLLTNLGLSYNTKGKLTVNDQRLKDLISQNAQSVSTSMATFSSKLSIKISTYVEREIPNQKATYEEQIKDIQKQELRVKAQLKVKQMMILNSENPLNELLNQPVNQEGGLLGLLSNSAKKKK
ncbi:MAG: flagellar filament capping protein FliD [Thermodesulfovibrionales bacterium]|nr:flagellar filament capping protein FliD [Thermodesulfovibrionales bacterium]